MQRYKNYAICKAFLNKLCINSLYLKITESNNGKSIVQNALKEASKQGAIAIISDSRLDKELIEAVLKERVKDVLYKHSVVVFIDKEELRVLNRTGGR